MCVNKHMYNFVYKYLQYLYISVTLPLVHRNIVIWDQGIGFISILIV